MKQQALRQQGEVEPSTEGTHSKVGQGAQALKPEERGQQVS